MTSSNEKVYCQEPCADLFILFYNYLSLDLFFYRENMLESAQKANGTLSISANQSISEQLNRKSRGLCGTVGETFNFNQQINHFILGRF